MDDNPIALIDPLGLSSNNHRPELIPRDPCPSFSGSTNQPVAGFAADLFNRATGSNIAGDAIKQFTYTQTSTTRGNVTATVTSFMVSDGNTTVVSTTARIVYNSVLNQSTDLLIDPVDGMAPIPFSNPPDGTQEYLFSDVRVYTHNGAKLAEGGDAGGADPPEGNGSIGDPGFAESLIPIWGSGRSWINAIQNGEWGWATFHGVMAVTDALMVKTLVTIATKAIVKTAAKEAIEQAVKEESKVLLNTSRQLQAKFKHAADFGVSGNYSKANAAKFSAAINQHINAAGVQAINGTYRGQAVIHYLNPSTGLNVISSPTGQFISGWKLNPAQLENVLKHGGL